MEFVELKKQLKAQKPNACYVCVGDDDFLVDRAVAVLCALASEPKPFNCVDREFERSRDVRILAKPQSELGARVAVAYSA